MTVEEWLGKDNKLGIDIWSKKYQRNGESFDEWLDRVSGGNADVKELIKQKKFLFGGRILSNRGIDVNDEKSTYSNCFIAGTKITTRRGMINIEDVVRGDEVLTEDRSWQKVNETMRRKYRGDLLQIYYHDGNNNPVSITCTPNHQFAVDGEQWKRADELKSAENGAWDYLICESGRGLDCAVPVERVRRLINQDTIVYNLSVETNHTYVANGVVVHNCYVLSPPEDSIESIFDCAKQLARTYSYGGGCGIDISKLSPRGAKVRNAAKETSGAVSFMDLYSLITGLIAQSGRRGALMISISCEHPDLEEFIDLKTDVNRCTKANISIRITDKFMAAVKNKQKFTLSFTRPETGETITKEVDAYKIFQKICAANWDYAEPGMLFWDRIENWNMMSEDEDFHYAGVNPLTNMKHADLKPLLIDLDEDYNSTGRKFKYSVND